MRILFLLLLLPFGAFAQSTPYYLADGLQSFSDQQIRGTNPVYLTFFGTDSAIISTSANAYEHASEYKRRPGENFLRRTKEWGTSMPNYLFLFEKAFFLIEEQGSYILFHKDQASANGLLNNSDKKDILHLKDSLRTVVTTITTRQRADADKAASIQNKKIITAWMKGYHSRRSDASLVQDIKKWSKNETTVVYIVDENYYITRNYRGEVLNKNIPAIIKYHLNGKCYIQWRAFGYEALGGGNFGKDMYTYNKNDYYLTATGAGGSVRIEPGVVYEIDCD